MEGMLSKFQVSHLYTTHIIDIIYIKTDLGSISAEIQSLQDQSRSMSVKLQNRQVCNHWWVWF